MKLSPNEPCPCESGRKYKQCCRPLHQGRPAPDPEALMRSRYSAYSLGLARYIIQSTHPESPLYQADLAGWEAQLNIFCRITRFLKLEVLSNRLDLAKGLGWVTFRATMFQGEKDVSVTERSLFKQAQGRWFYVSGDTETPSRATPW